MVRLRPAVKEDLDFILGVEAEAGRQHFVSTTNRDEHQRAMVHPDARYLIIEEGGASRGYVILQGLLNSHRNIELKRIVVSEPGKGIGRSAIQKVLSWAFHERAAHRVWLDVFEDNLRARHLYESVGFQAEGILREAGLRSDGYHSLIVMSILDREYEELHTTFPKS